MAVLKLVNKYITYERDGLLLTVEVSPYLRYIYSIKSFDNGFITVIADYGNGVEEEYIDLEFVPDLLGLSDKKKDYFEGVTCEDIEIVNGWVDES